ncbi:MAG: hypothetical protein ACM3KL_06445 [Alphaproteobacteria bacterium]
MQSNTDGGFNTTVGNSALLNNTTGSNNGAIGTGALASNTTGANNTASGFQALFISAAAENNTAFGSQSLKGNTTATRRSAPARSLATLMAPNIRPWLANNTSGFQNLALGGAAGASVTTENNVICIGSTGLNVNSSCFRRQYSRSHDAERQCHSSGYRLLRPAWHDEFFAPV